MKAENRRLGITSVKISGLQSQAALMCLADKVNIFK